MAPEQTDRKGKITPATDVWALGLLAFFMLTGRSFWLEAEGSLTGILKEVCVDEIPFATARARELGVEKYLPPGFDAWFAMCVNRSQDARFPEAGACVRAFAELVGPSSARAGKLVIEAPATNTDLLSSPLTAEFPGMTAGQGQMGTAGGSPVHTASGGTPGPLVASDGNTGAAAAPPRKSTGMLLLLIPAAAVIGGGLFFFLRDKTPADPVAGPNTAAAMGSAPAAATSGSGAAAAGGVPSCPEGMVVVSGGKMFMGARDLTPETKPPHEVSISTFCLDVTEVTTAAYMACVDKGECERPLDKVSWPNITPDKVQRYSTLCNATHKERGDHPINCVAWAMADRFCKKRGARLPSEAEWEFAARGSSQRKYPWGDEEPNEKRLNACGVECQKWGAANGDARDTMYPGDDGFYATAPVGSFKAGASVHGVMDLAGNVWEWTADYYAPYTEAAVADPKGPDQGTQRVLRGGDFFGFNADWARPAYRWKTDPDTYNHAIGFRCAADVKPR
jgi:formylglycine-generating enzyme required for sulfatase activity